MYKFIYQGIIYDSKKELKAATKLNSKKFAAKLRDNEIKLITNTGAWPYETLHNDTI